MIPTCRCREKYMKDAYPNGTRFQRASDIGEDEINPYWEGNVKEDSKVFLNGYDYAVKNSIDSFFDNLEVYEDVLSELFTKHQLKEINTEALKLQNVNFNQEQYDQQNDTTRLFMLLKLILLDWSEVQRNEMIVSMIENDESDKD